MRIVFWTFRELSLDLPCRVRYSLSDRTSASSLELKSQKISKNVGHAATTRPPLLPSSIQLEKKLDDYRIYSDRESSKRISSGVEVEDGVGDSRGGQLEYSSSDSSSKSTSRKVSSSDSSSGSSPGSTSSSDSSKKVSIKKWSYTRKILSFIHTTFYYLILFSHTWTYCISYYFVSSHWLKVDLYLQWYFRSWEFPWEIFKFVLCHLYFLFIALNVVTSSNW